MSFWKKKNIDVVWANICKYEGEAFFTVTNVEYNYVVKDNYILINNDPRRKITKAYIEKALETAPIVIKIRSVPAAQMVQA